MVYNCFQEKEVEAENALLVLLQLLIQTVVYFLKIP